MILGFQVTGDLVKGTLNVVVKHEDIVVLCSVCFVQTASRMIASLARDLELVLVIKKLVFEQCI